jgi:peptidoglycan L-alanyl-D-glutamate endopeptidase CwlK
MANTFQLRYGKGKGTATPVNKNTEINQDISKTKFRQFSKNIIKSSANLTVDVVGNYLPNTKTFVENADEARKQAISGVKTTYAKVKNVYTKILGLGGESNKEPKAALRSIVKETFDDTLSRLKKGQFYQSKSEMASANNPFTFADDFSEFNDFNTFDDINSSTQYADPTTTLSDEPFGEPLTSVEKKAIRSRKRIPRRSSVTTTNNGAPQLTLGDKLISDTTQYSASAIIDEQERLFNKQFAADEVRHIELMKYQHNISATVGKIAEHLQAVEGEGITKLIEAQNRVVQLQENTIDALNELKQAVVVTSPSYEKNIEKNKSRYSKILGGVNGLDFGEYGKNVKGNIMELAYRSPVGMMLGLTPMLGSFLGMGDSALNNKTKFDPLSMLMRMGVNSLLTRQTRGRLSSLDDITSGIGPLFIAQMNKMARFSDNSFARTIGQVFGVKNTFAKKVNLGLEDIDAKVSWTAKSDRTLNVVIPGYLAKMTAALTGGEETFYDYNAGTFRKASSISKEYERVKKAAMYDTTVSEYATRMLNPKYQEKETKSLISGYKKANAKITDATIKKDFDQIMKNITKSGFHYSPEYLQDKSYRSQLLQQVANDESLVIFDKMFHRLDAEEQLILNRKLSERNVQYENAMLDFNNNIIKSGGGAALQNAIATDEKKRLQYELQYSQHLQTKDAHGNEIPKNSQAYAMIKKRRQEVEKRIESLGLSGGGQIEAIHLNADGSTKFGDLSSSQDSSTSMLGSLNNIFSLLSQGIIVFPQKLPKGQLPEHLKKIKSINAVRESAIRERNLLAANDDEQTSQSILDTEIELADISRAQKNLMNARIGDIIGSVTGLKAFEIFNPVNQLGAVVADSGIKGLGKLFNASGPSGPGLFSETQYERDINKFRQDTSSGSTISGKQNFIDPLRENEVAYLEKLKENMKQGGFVGTISKWLYPNLEKKINKQRNLGIDPKTGIAKIRNPTGVEKQNVILSAVEKAYDDFVGKYIFKKSTSVTEEEDKQQFKTFLFSELKEKGIESKEAINIVSQVVNEPLDKKSKKEADPDITAEEVSAITGISVAAVVKKFGKTVKASVLKQDKSIKQFFDAGGRLKYDENGNMLFDENHNIVETKEGLGHKFISQTKDIFTKGGDLKQSLSAMGNEKIGQFIANFRKKPNEAVVSDKAAGSEQKSMFGEFGSFMKNKLDGFIQPQKETDEEKEAHKLAVISYNILEEMLQEVVSRNADKEPTFKDIDEAVQARVKSGQLDAEIAHEVMNKAIKISKDKDKGANPVNAYYSAIYEMKESYNEKYRKEHSIIGNIKKKIFKSGVKGIAATTLLLTGHPIMAAMLAFGPKKIIKGGVAGVKGIFKGSKFLAGLSAKVLGTAAKMTPGIAKTGLSVLGRVLGGDIFDSKPKKSREQLDQERDIAALAFTALEAIHRELMETNPDAKMGDIKKAIEEKVKAGNIDGEIADAIIKATEINLGDKDADATPLGAFLQAILTLKKQYSKQYKKDTSVTRKIAMGILKGAGKGIGAAALLMSGHPILAAALALSGPAKLAKSIKNRFSKTVLNGKIPEANPISQEKDAVLQSSEEKITEQTETAKEGILKKLPGVLLGASSSLNEKVSKAKETVGSAFSAMKGNVSNFFGQERREGSYFDHKEDKKEEQQLKNQDEQTKILKDIRDNTHYTEEELDEKDKRQKSLFGDIFKKIGIGAGVTAGVGGLGAIINSVISGVVHKGIGTALTHLAGKGGRIGNIAKFASKFIGGGKTAAVGKTALGVLGQSGGLGSKALGLLGKAGGLGSKAAGLLGKAGGLGGKAAGLLGKAGGIAGKFAPALGGLAKFAGPVGIALAAAQAIGGGVKGWKNAAQIAGLGEGEEATTGQKIGSALSGGLSSLTLGLLKPEMIYGAGKKVGSFFKSAFGKQEYELNEDGTPKLDENGQPIKKKRGFAASVLRKAAFLNPITAPAMLAKLAVDNKDKIAGKVKSLFGKKDDKVEYELDENGKPKLDENGNPIIKDKELSQGKIVSGGIIKKISDLKNLGKKSIIKPAGETLHDIYNLLSKGILVFPSELNKENAPSHLKNILKQGKYESTSALKNSYLVNGPMNGMGSGSLKKQSMFDKVKTFFSNLRTGGSSGGQSYYGGSSGGNYTTNSANYNVSYQQGYNNSAYNQTPVNFDVDKIKSPEQASLFFYNNAEQASNQLQNMLYNGEYGEIERLANNIKDPAAMGQNANIDSLEPEFRQRVENFLNSPEAQAKGVRLREARRSPLTQLAYFTKGRAPDVGFIHHMFKKAGFSDGAWDPYIQNTQTIGSKHFLGQAIDIEDGGKGESFYREIAPIAKKYGLAWGGDWQGFEDYPHFEMPRNDSDIGYSGPPKDTGLYPEITTQRADGYGNNRFGEARLIGRLPTTSSVSNRYQQDDYLGTTTSTALHLKESPVITSDKELINQINAAINIQKSIYDEQRRHNSVSENFFTSLINLLTEINRGSSQQTSRGGDNSQLSTLSAIMKAEQVAKEYFSSNARTMAMGY